MILTVCIGLVLSVIAYLLCHTMKHQKLLKKGFEAVFISAVIAVLETIISSDSTYLHDILQYIQLIMFVILSCLVTSVAKIFIFSHLSPNMLAVFSIVYWISFTAAYLSPSSNATICMQLVAGFVGFILTDFFALH